MKIKSDDGWIKCTDRLPVEMDSDESEFIWYFFPGGQRRVSICRYTQIDEKSPGYWHAKPKVIPPVPPVPPRETTDERDVAAAEEHANLGSSHNPKEDVRHAFLAGAAYGRKGQP